MRFVAISDTHNRHGGLRLPRGEVLLHAGDISYKGRKEEVVDFLKWFGGLPFRYKIFIAGNHDFFFEKSSPGTIQALLPKDVFYLQDSGITVNNIRIWGSPVTPWFFNWAFNRKRGAPIKAHWDMVPSDTNILITHGPPFGILDQVVNGRQAGCMELLEKVKELKPAVHLFGHIHESNGKRNLEGTTFINASVLNETYERVHAPVVFDL